MSCNRKTDWCVLACRLMAAGCGLLSLQSMAGEESRDAEEVWRLGAQGLFAEAELALPETMGGEEEAFTRAVLQLNRQPRTEADLTQAVAQLRELARVGSSPEFRARCWYHATRAESWTIRGIADERTLNDYRQLWEHYPDQVHGQRALVYVLLLTFDSEEPREVVLSRCGDLEEEGEKLTEAAVRSQFHQVAARGYLQMGGLEDHVLRHLVATAELGAARRATMGDLHVSIGQVAAELGETALAKKHYGEFLRLFPNDPRTYTINFYLKKLTDPQ